MANKCIHLSPGPEADTIGSMNTRPVPTVVSVNISPGGIPKRPLDEVMVTERGLTGDGHNHDKHNTPIQAVSVIDVEDLDELRTEGFNVSPGATGENLTDRGLDVDALAVGDQLHFSGGLELVLTKVRHPCYVLDAIDPQLKGAIVGRCGYLAKVAKPAIVRPGESITVVHAGAAIEHAVVT